MNRTSQTRSWRIALPLLLIMALGVFSSPAVSAAEGIRETLLNDQRNYYSKERLLRLGVAFGIGGVVANSSIDENFQDRFQSQWRSGDTNDFSDVANFFGEGQYMLPISLVLAGVSFIDEDSVIGEFGAKMARSYLVGLPPMWAMQRMTGASRPGENPHGSSWRPLNDANGVSGHAFVGAVPFLVGAGMTDNVFARGALYVASAATAFSRVNFDVHYLSQVALGWYMAYEATGAVQETNRSRRVTVIPVVGQDFHGVVVSARW